MVYVCVSKGKKREVNNWLSSLSKEKETKFKIGSKDRKEKKIKENRRRRREASKWDAKVSSNNTGLVHFLTL